MEMGLYSIWMQKQNGFWEVRARPEYMMEIIASPATAGGFFTIVPPEKPMVETSGRQLLGLGRRWSRDHWDGVKLADMKRFGSWRRRYSKTCWGIQWGGWEKGGIENEMQIVGRKTWVLGVPFMKIKKVGRVGIWRECGMSQDFHLQVYLSHSMFKQPVPDNCCLFLWIYMPAVWALFAEEVEFGKELCRRASSSSQQTCCWDVPVWSGVSPKIFNLIFVKCTLSSVQLLSCVQLFATPWIAALQASLSITNSWSLLKLMSIKLLMPPNHLILCCPLLFPPSIFPSIRVFSNESALHITWPKYWGFSFSISPSNEYSGLISFRMDWLNLLAVQGTLKSLLQHHNSLVLSFFYGPTLMFIHDYWKNHSLD